MTGNSKQTGQNEGSHKSPYADNVTAHKSSSAGSYKQSTQGETGHEKSRIWELENEQEADDFLLFKDFIDVNMLNPEVSSSMVSPAHDTSTTSDTLRSQERASDSVQPSRDHQALDPESGGGSEQEPVIFFKYWNSHTYRTFERSCQSFLTSAQEICRTKIPSKMRRDTYRQFGEEQPPDEYDALLWTNRKSDAKKQLKTILDGWISNDEKSTLARDQASKHGQDWVKSQGGTEFPFGDDDLWFFASLKEEPIIKWGKK